MEQFLFSSYIINMLPVVYVVYYTSMNCRVELERVWELNPHAWWVEIKAISMLQMFHARIYRGRRIYIVWSYSFARARKFTLNILFKLPLLALELLHPTTHNTTHTCKCSSARLSVCRSFWAICVARCGVVKQFYNSVHCSTHADSKLCI